MKKKILLVTNGFPYGESEKSFLSTEYEQLRQNFDVYILALIAEENKVDLIEDKNVFCSRHKRLTISSVVSQLIHGYVLGEIFSAMNLKQPVLSLKRVNAILRYSARANDYKSLIDKLCKDYHIDLIYTYWCSQATLAAIQIKNKSPNMRVITRFHGYDLYQERTPELWQPFRRMIAKHCDRLVFAAEFAKKYFCSNWGDENIDKMDVAYLGSPAKDRLPHSSLNVLHLISCSNAIELKRIDVIIDALELLPEEIEVHWHHIGGGPLMEELQQRAVNKLSEHKNLTWKFWGFLPNCELNEKYKELQANLFITTSTTEGGVPISIAESMAMGIPVIGTKVGGIPEILSHKENGYLMSQHPDAKEVATAIIKYSALSDEQKRTFSDNAILSWKNKFNALTTATQFCEYLRTLLKEKEVCGLYEKHN